jgi:ATP-dependent DNA helicase RecG
MNHADLKQILDGLISTWENEVIEFKEANDNFSTNDIGKYFSALANEANLQNVESGWLVFGVRDADKSIIGTGYRQDSERLQSLKQQIYTDTGPSITFRNIHELHDGNLRVVMMQIPAAPLGMPIAWKGHYYARAGESLVSLGLDKQDEIRNQTLATDWSAQIVTGATVNDLDADAIQKARDAFGLKHANRIDAVDIAGWSAENFLDKVKLTQGGKITHAAILLLGKSEKAYLLNPHPAQMTWKLVGSENAYEHFGPPFFINSTQLYQKIRNIQLRLLPDNQLVPYEISKYDTAVVLEALHNCIAHQDYLRNGRVVVTEFPEKLTFESEGGFFDGSPDEYVTEQRTPRRYRNPFLAQAMVELSMIDTMGYGIHRMHIAQQKRYFPMPDYVISNSSVSMTIYGGIVDPAYTFLLMQNSSLQLGDVLALDRVQKRLAISDTIAKHLKREGLIEGRKPHYHVSAKIAAVTASRADYILTRAQDDKHYAKLLTDFLQQYGSATRQDVDKLLLNKLSDALSDAQKSQKISNLITKLRRAGGIKNTGSKKVPKWEITHKNAE